MCVRGRGGQEGGWRPTHLAAHGGCPSRVGRPQRHLSHDGACAKSVVPILLLLLPPLLLLLLLLLTLPLLLLTPLLLLLLLLVLLVLLHSY